MEYDYRIYLEVKENLLISSIFYYYLKEKFIKLIKENNLYILDRKWEVIWF